MRLENTKTGRTESLPIVGALAEQAFRGSRINVDVCKSLILNQLVRESRRAMSKVKQTAVLGPLCNHARELNETVHVVRVPW